MRAEKRTKLKTLRLLVGAVDGTPLGTRKTIVNLALEKTALGMPDGHFSIIEEKPFFNLNLQIRVHPIRHCRRRCPFHTRYHENLLKKTNNFLLLGGLFEPILNGWALPKSSLNNDAQSQSLLTRNIQQFSN